MTSNLGCVGLGVDDMESLGALLTELIPTSTPSRQEDGSVLYDWRDASGARLVITTDRSGAIADVTPAYAGEAGADLAGLVPLHDAIVLADVTEDGEVCTRMAVEVLAPRPVPASGRAVVTAFGLDVSLHESAAAYAASPASLLVPHEEGGDDGDEPRRMAEESFLSFGAFDDPADSEPVARLAGTVLSSRTATVAATGQAFHAVRVRTVGMQVDLCLPTTDHPHAPEPGWVVAGTAYLVADVERPTGRRGRRFGRRGR